MPFVSAHMTPARMSTGVPGLESRSHLSAKEKPARQHQAAFLTSVWGTLDRLREAQHMGTHSLYLSNNQLSCEKLTMLT